MLRSSMTFHSSHSLPCCFPRDPIGLVPESLSSSLGQNMGLIRAQGRDGARRRAESVAKLGLLEVGAWPAHGSLDSKELRGCQPDVPSIPG